MDAEPGLLIEIIHSIAIAMYTKCHATALLLLILGGTAAAQTAAFGLRAVSDSLNILTLTTDSTRSEWPLHYPVYRMCTGDVDGNGSIDAIVGVVKATRYSPKAARRIFIFKNYHGLVRPMWMGSRLGGEMEDFRFDNRLLTCLQRTTDDRYVVAQYEWDHFGMSFVRYLARNISKEEAITIFNQTISP